MTESAESNRIPAIATPHVGAFVLETLTLGMYGEPCHTLREYVQNSFDAIRAAQRTRFLTARGRVDVTFASERITIRDNGLGVKADQAWKTLTSVGASKKDRQRDAGFRGIGRLAGMAYCDELIFRTTFPGETTLTTLRFDCKSLLKAMSPDEGGDVELSKLLLSAITFKSAENAVLAEEHFFEVTLNGLDKAPETLTDVSNVCDYLSETIPVDFHPDWNWGKKIEAGYQEFFSASLESIDLFVHTDSSTTQIYKPHGDIYEFAKGSSKLKTVDFFPSDDGKYWGWIGRLSDSGAVTDTRTRGLRVRVRNIQVDGTEIFERLFSQVKPSYGRFSSYYVGEIHIDPERVIPNARRDGFEETKEWLETKAELIENLCRPLATGAYEASKEGQTDVKKVIDDIEKLIERARHLVENSRASYDDVVDLMNTAKRLRRRASAALKIIGDFDDTATDCGDSGDRKLVALQDASRSVESIENQARLLIGRFLGEEERIAGLKARLRQEIVKELLDIVNPFVDPATYQQIRRQLTKSD